MTAKKKKEKKVMEEKRPSLPEVVTVRKRPRTPGVTLNRLRYSEDLLKHSVTFFRTIFLCPISKFKLAMIKIKLLNKNGIKWNIVISEIK